MEVMMIFEALFGIIAAVLDCLNLDYRLFPLKVITVLGAVVIHFWVPAELARYLNARRNLAKSVAPDDPDAPPTVTLEDGTTGPSTEAVSPNALTYYIWVRGATTYPVLAVWVIITMLGGRSVYASTASAITMGLMSLSVVPLVIVVDLQLARLYNRLGT